MIIGLTFLYELIKMKSAMTYLPYVLEQIKEACVIQFFQNWFFRNVSISILSPSVTTVRAPCLSVLKILVPNR